ncbi:MAG TPA: response regulator [Exilispira sp.]|nr:response regulator [Exilispira sp.]
MNSDKITIDLPILLKAIEIYMKMAYPDNNIPQNIKSKLESIYNSKNIEEALNLFKYEEFNGSPSYKLQLGSSRYPFLKLVYEKATFSNEYGFYIDRHSEYIAVDSSSPDFSKELEIKNYTSELKFNLENEFEKQNIPTYRRLVKEYVEKCKNNLGSSSISKKGKLILLVEDDPDINDMHKLELMILGYDVESVFNGYDALKMVENKYFDLMLLDLMMSGISGQEVIKRVGKEIDIVVLSALSDKFTKDTCLKLGAKAYLTKPVHKDDLNNFLIDFFNKKENKQT